ncbi:MAG: hypothetical protein J4F45_02265 [Pseudomonadales bacterium]|nr:hypothetical protein [Pseudomonadales bacterium]
MKRIALVIVGVIGALYVIAIFLPIDPVERRAGTGLSGELAADQDTDWAFLEGRTRAWLETRTWYLVPHSITVSAWPADGILYVGCRQCDTKRWPKNVARDNRVRVKVGDALYERRAIRITDPAERQAVLGARTLEPGLAVFRMAPR